MTRWLLLVGGFLVTASLGWSVLQVALMAPAERSDASGFGQFVLAAVGLVIMIVGGIRKALAPAPAPDLGRLADLLARPLARSRDRVHR